MNNINLKSGINRLCLISLILLSSFFANENAFSQTYWQKNNVKIAYIKKFNIITLSFLIYDYDCAAIHGHGWLGSLQLLYTEDDRNYLPLMSISVEKQESKKGTTLAKLSNKEYGQKLRLEHSVTPAHGTFWPDDDKALNIEVRVTKGEVAKNSQFKDMKSYVTLKWKLPESMKQIKKFKTWGIFNLQNKNNNETFNDVYPVNFVFDQSITKNNAPSQLESEISDQLKVLGREDEITVSGTEPNENITVYDDAGKEVRSVVASENTVNIKLEKNKLYTVKVGQKSYKVAL